jgi:hypothetical protein
MRTKAAQAFAIWGLANVVTTFINLLNNASVQASHRHGRAANPV